MMILESDVTLHWPSQVVHQMAYQISVQPHFDVRSCRLDFERIPLAQRPRCERGRWCELIDRTCRVQRTSFRIRVGVQCPVIDLDFVALVYCQLPVFGRLLLSENRQATKHTWLIECIDRPSLHPHSKA